MEELIALKQVLEEEMEQIKAKYSVEEVSDVMLEQVLLLKKMNDDDKKRLFELVKCLAQVDGLLKEDE